MYSIRKTIHILSYIFIVSMIFSVSSSCFAAQVIAKYTDHPPQHYIECVKELNVYLCDTQNVESGYEYIESDHCISIQYTGSDIIDEYRDQQYYLERYALKDISERQPCKTAILDTGVDTEHEDIMCSGDNDVHGHGTAVAGVIAAVKQNRIGIQGISETQLHSIQVMDEHGNGTYFSLIKGIVQAVEHGAKIICIPSGGKHHSEMLRAAVEYAYKKNVIIISAAGNTHSQQILYPAAYDHVISVGAVNNEGEPCNMYDWGFDETGTPLGSSYSKKIDLMAVGTNIFTTHQNNTYHYFSGTSMSTAIITGIAAYIAGNIPDITFDELCDKIEKILNGQALDLHKKNADNSITSFYTTAVHEQHRDSSEKKEQINVNDTISSPEIALKRILGNTNLPKRRGHTCTVFKDKMWIIGGFKGNKYFNDVWCSENGVNWKCVTDNAAFSPRAKHSCIVFNEKLWIIAGETAEKYNDIWCSEDGIRWMQIVEKASFSRRNAHTVDVLNNTLYLIGGEDNKGLNNDVWYSKDGIRWARLNGNAPFSPRAYHSSVVKDKYIYIIGGIGAEDIWRSENGLHWECVSQNSGCGEIFSHTSLLYKDSIVIVGGYNEHHSGDVWCIKDHSWIQPKDHKILSSRNLHTSVVFKNSVYIIGGFDGLTSLNDIWALTIK